MRVYLGADHAGFETKNLISEHLTKQGHDVIDCGAHTYDAEDDYPAFCIEGAQRAANKVRGARCALAWSPETARLAREHNNAQLIGIGGRMHSQEEALEIVDAFLDQEWSRAERHQRRIDILAEYERTNIPPELPKDPR